MLSAAGVHAAAGSGKGRMCCVAAWARGAKREAAQDCFGHQRVHRELKFLHAAHARRSALYVTKTSREQFKTRCDSMIQTMYAKQHLPIHLSTLYRKPRLLQHRAKPSSRSRSPELKSPDSSCSHGVLVMPVRRTTAPGGAASFNINL